MATPARPHGPILTLLLVAALGGCSAAEKVTGPPGDDAGEHLVVFGTDRVGTAGAYDIVVYDLDNGGFRSLAGLNASGPEFEPCLSNDGRFVTFNAARGAGGPDIFVYDRLTQGLLATPGLNTAAAETHPRFTYDSVHLAFVRDSSSSTRIRLYEPVGDTLIQLPGIDAPGSASDDQPAPNLDGSRIAFTSTRTGRREVHVWNRGAGVTQPAGLAGDGIDLSPSLSSDGRWLAFASTRSAGAGAYDIYLYDLLAGAMVRLPRLNTGAGESHPAVSADGNRIVFESDRAGGGGQRDLYLYTRSDSSVAQPAGFRNAADDHQPYLRWR